MSKLSTAEKDFIKNGIELDLRADGRTRLDVRSFSIETGIISQASGSCRCNLDGTDVLVGVKVEIETVSNARTAENMIAENEGEISESTDFQDCGKILCTVDCSPSASRILDANQKNHFAVKASEFLNSMLNGPQSGIDLKALNIIPGSSFWVIRVDVLVLDYAGNALDTIMLATRGALNNTRMPRCIVEQIGDKFEFELSEDETEVIPGYLNVPVCVTLNKIGSRHIVDASILEELCSEARLIVAINPKGHICSITKDGVEGIAPNLLVEMMLNSKKIGLEFLNALDNVLRIEEGRIRRGGAPLGFMA